MPPEKLVLEITEASLVGPDSLAQLNTMAKAKVPGRFTGFWLTPR
jgi:hypothetical protein